MTTPPDFSVGQVLTAAQMNAVGLWLVKTQTVGTAVPSVTVSDCFSADYDNYRIIVAGGTATGGNVLFQLNNSTGSTYNTAGVYLTYGSATVTGYGPATTTSWLVGYFGTGMTGFSMDIYNPNKATQTRMSVISASGYYYSFTGQDTSTAQSTGFTLTPSPTTITGQEIRVYGYRN